MKGVVLSGGLGTRLRPITYSMAKQLVPVANEPILFYPLRDIAAVGIEDVAIVVSPETGGEVRATVGDGSRFGLRVQYVEQPEPNGIAAALQLALRFVGDEDCLLYLGDNIVEGGLDDVVAEYREYRPDCQILLAVVEEPERYGVAELALDGSVTRLVEKPLRSVSNLALVGVYLFTPVIGEAVASLRPSHRGQFEITDAIQYLIDTGREVRATHITGWWKDTGRKVDLLHANELILRSLQGRLEGEVEGGRVQGPVVLRAGSKLIDSTVTGPVTIGAATRVERSVIGPFTSIGDHCHLADVVVDNSIVMEDAEIQGWKLRDSLVGRRARLVGQAPPGLVTVTLGEHSAVGSD